MAHLETRLWRDYYGQNYFSLGRGLYAVGREQFHVSPWDSVRLAWHAGRAAIRFKDSPNRSGSERALADLRDYYRVIQERAQPELDVAAMARVELEWWQVRREKAAPAEVARLVARSYEHLFQTRNEDVQTAARLRVAAMVFRDEHGTPGLTAPEWDSVQAQLLDSYRHLSAGVNGPAARDRRTTAR